MPSPDKNQKQDQNTQNERCVAGDVQRQGPLVMASTSRTQMSGWRIAALAVTSILLMAAMQEGFWLAALLGVLTIGATLPWGRLLGHEKAEPFDRGLTIMAICLGVSFLAAHVSAYSQSPEGKAAAARRVQEDQAEAAREAAEKRKEALAAAENKRKGFHCLSNWDGSHRAMVDMVKERLRSPSSFEHVETAITPVDHKGQHQLIMTYRAENGFGGMNVERAVGEVDTADCHLAELSLVR